MYKEIVTDYTTLYPHIGNDVRAVAQQFKCSPAKIQETKIRAATPGPEQHSDGRFKVLFDKIKKLFVTKRDKR